MTPQSPDSETAIRSMSRDDGAGMNASYVQKEEGGGVVAGVPGHSDTKIHGST